MNIKLKAIKKNNETNKEEPYDLSINTKDIACLYKDKYGVAITTYGGKFYRVNHSIEELQELL